MGVILTKGIYCIENKFNHKKYIGKSINIEQRLANHKCYLKRNTYSKKHCNRHLWSSVQKYGLENFDFYIVEVLDSEDENLFSDRELYWIDYFNTVDRNYGYNLRRDSSTKMFVHPETKEIFSKIFAGENNPNYGYRWSEEMKADMSNLKIEQHNSPDSPYNDEWRSKISKASSNLWKDEDKKQQMAMNVSLKVSKYKFFQYDKDMTLIRVWNSISEITSEFPDYHVQAIYSVCNGWKKSYKGFIWLKELKI